MGGGVRRKKSRRNATIKILRNQKKNIAIGDKVLKEHWDSSKTLKQNMKELGLAYDANSSIKELQKRKKPSDEEEGENKEMEIVEEVNTAVITEFEKEAKKITKHERHVSPDEAKFLMGLMKTHKTNYDNMCRDKRNTYQHTAKKLQFKCEGLVASSLYERYIVMFPDLVEKNME